MLLSINQQLIKIIQHKRLQKKFAQYDGEQKITTVSKIIDREGFEDELLLNLPQVTNDLGALVDELEREVVVLHATELSNDSESEEDISEAEAAVVFDYYANYDEQEQLTPPENFHEYSFNLPLFGPNQSELENSFDSSETASTAESISVFEDVDDFTETELNLFINEHLDNSSDDEYEDALSF